MSEFYFFELKNNSSRGSNFHEFNINFILPNLSGGGGGINKIEWPFIRHYRDNFDLKEVIKNMLEIFRYRKNTYTRKLIMYYPNGAFITGVSTTKLVVC